MKLVSSCALTVLAAAVIFSLAVSFQARAEDVLDGAISYTPPIPMYGGEQAGNAGLPISGWEFRTEGTTNGYAQVTFQLMSVLALFPNSSAPEMEVRNTAELKAFLERRYQAKTNLLNPRIAPSKFSKREAVSATTRNLDAPWKWQHSTCLLWVTNKVWLRNTVLCIFVVAEKESVFKTLVRSLQTATINPPPPVRLVQNQFALGMSQSEIRDRCGEPFEYAGPNESYFTQHLFISLRYGDSDRADYIAYAKVRDVQQAARSKEREELLKQLTSMSKSEAEKILQINSDKHLMWSLVGENKWKRSDGAMAFLTPRSLVVASPEMWPKIHFDDAKK